MDVKAEKHCSLELNETMAQHLILVDRLLEVNEMVINYTMRIYSTVCTVI